MNDEALILEAQAASVEAWNRGDLSAHLAVYDESVTTLTPAGPRHGTAPIESAFRAGHFLDEESRQTLRMEQVAVRLLSSQGALMTGRYVLTGARKPELSGWYTLVWLRTAAGWKVIHDHSG